MTLNRWKSVSLVAGLAFAAGSFLTARLMQINQVRADSNRVFELRVYHTVPGKAGALQEEFRDKVTKLFAKHDLKALGYWAPLDPPTSENTFVYILAHPSREDAKKHWAAFTADPDFQAMIKSQQAPDAKVVEKVDSTYMQPTDFSPTK
jgi:NIPSNAP